VRRPRVSDAQEPFRSKVLPLFARRTKELGLLLPELYLHGLSLGDFELALRGLLGEGAPLSPSSIARLKAASGEVPGRIMTRRSRPSSALGPERRGVCRSWNQWISFIAYTGRCTPGQ